MKQEQFNLLLASEGNALTPQALKFTQDVDDAKDLIQDTLLKAFLNSDKFTEGTNLKGWLYTIMRNLFVNNYRKRHFRTCPIETEEAHRIFVENQGEANINIENIKAAMEALPEQRYRPLRMYLDGYKYHEITDALSIPIGTVKNRIHLARRTLKKNLLLHEELNIS